MIVAVGAATFKAPTPTLIGSLGSLPSASATTVTVSPSESSGTVTVQLPSSSVSAVTGSSPGISTVTVEPGSAVPPTDVSPACTGSIVGVVVWSAGTTMESGALRYSSPPAVTTATT